MQDRTARGWTSSEQRCTLDPMQAMHVVIPSCLALVSFACDAGNDDAGAEVDPADQAEIDALASELEQMIAGAHAAYQASDAPQSCPEVGASPSEAGFTPPLELDCSLAPERRCSPIDMGGGLGQYDPALWTENAIWAALGFAKTSPHLFHYDFTTTNDLQGTCSFTAEAKGDLDGDGVFSSYRITGTIDGEGVHANPLEVVDGLE
jgi:hypothetical protein